jgi:2-oxoglutarate ferredoxin oxidoreductase subunit gamma
MLIKTIFAGFGGQGVLSMGLNFTQAAMRDGKYVTYLPSYGAEMRGGTANCTVAISDEEIASPVASSPWYTIVLNQPSLMKFQNRIQSGGVLFVNSTLVNLETITRGDIEVVKVPANEMAEKMGNIRSANMIMLGAFVRKSNLVKFESLVDGLAAALKNNAKSVAINKEALTAGYNLFK